MRERIGYERLPTERANRASRALDRLSPLEISVLMTGRIAGRSPRSGV